ncbi:MAG: type II toxin-antitoxin system ParD family antitoxin [Rhizonema sp. NSF051]|nr:type II toxin-antitoxin system ParD family antitoxin [Rhizonema sp. NSF051]
MYIQIKPELEQFIQAQLASGRFISADDVINEAFKLLQEREERIEELRQKIAVENEQIAKGQVTDGEVVFARLQEVIEI